MSLFNIGNNEKQLSILNDPFKKDKVQRIHIFVYPQENRCSGGIKFQNGATTGEQEFKAETLVEIVKKMEAFINTL